MNESGPTQPDFESPQFETGDLITCRITEPVEFIDIIGSAYAAAFSRFGEDARALIKTASQFLVGKRFKILQYFPAYPGEAHTIQVLLDDTSLTKESFLNDAEAARLNKEFEESYQTEGTGILFFLQTTPIVTDAAYFEKVT